MSEPRTKAGKALHEFLLALGISVIPQIAAIEAEAATHAAEPCPKCACCTVEASQHGLCGACNIGEECETCPTMLAAPSEPEPPALDEERRRITDALFAWAEKHNADPPLVVVVGIVDVDGVQAAEAVERIRAALATREEPGS